MPTPEKIFKNRGIVAKGNTLSPEEIVFLSYDKTEKVLNPRRMQLVIEKAETFLDYQIPVIPLSTFRRYYTDGNRGANESIYYPRREALLHLALAEWYERKGRFTEKLADVIWATLEETTWLVAAHYRFCPGCEDGVPNFHRGEILHDIALFACATGAIFAFIYKNCKDFLDEISPVICDRIKYEVNERIIKPYLNKMYYWMGYMSPYSGNWLTWITSNVLYVISVFGDDTVIREGVVQKAMGSLDSFFSAYNPDGGCEEGASYWNGAAGDFLNCLDLLYDISGGKINVYDHPLIKVMGEYRVDVNIFDNYVVNFSDSPREVGVSTSLMRRFGEAVGSPDMIAYGQHLSKTSGIDFHFGHIYPMVRALYEKDFEGEALELVAKEAVHYNHIDIAMFREKPIRGEGWFFAIKGGHNDEKHNHDDVGTVMLYRDKTPIIVDLGRGSYINWKFATREKTFYKDSDFHSIPTIGGAIQGHGRSFKATDVTFCAEEKSFTLNLGSAYPADAGIIEYIRKAKLSSDGFVLTESLSLDSEKEVIFNFTTPEEPKIEGSEVVLNGGARLSLDAPAEIYVESHDTSFAGCTTWGKTVYRVCFKLTTAGGKFTFTIK